MKFVYFIFLIVMITSSCTKEFTNDLKPNGLRTAIYMQLNNQLHRDDFNSVDWTSMIRVSLVDKPYDYIQIGMQNMTADFEFIVLKIDKLGAIQNGLLIKLNRKENEHISEPFNGNITTTDLHNKNIYSAAIVNGFIVNNQLSQSLQTEIRGSVALEPDPYKTLPTVIVVAKIQSSQYTSYSTWLNLQSLFGSSAGTTGYYTDIDPLITSSGGGGGGFTGGLTGTVYNSSIPNVNPEMLEPEYIYSLPAINLAKYFRCFDYIPSAGATYTMKLCADIPVNNSPQVAVTSSAASAGHAFISITKTNGSSSITQSFGFYPKQQPSWWDPFLPLEVSMKDNGGMEINASIEMIMTEAMYNIVKQNALTWSSRKYLLADYNCADYAIDLFNSVRTTPIKVSPYLIQLPGGSTQYNPTLSNSLTVSINKSPQMLFSKLKNMKLNGDVEASSIKIEASNNYRAIISKGECN